MHLLRDNAIGFGGILLTDERSAPAELKAGEVPAQPESWMVLPMTNRSEYHIPTAVTFLMAGLGIGSLLAILLNPRSREREFVPSRTNERAV